METLKAVVPSMAETPARQALPSSLAIIKGCRARRGRINCLSTPLAWAQFRRIFTGAQTLTAGDVLLVSGTLGDHGATILNLREQLGLDGELVSDCAVLTPLIQTLRDIPGVKALQQMPPVVV